MSTDPDSTRSEQEQAWKHLTKTITGILNKVSADNIPDVLPQLLSVNLIKGRGILTSRIIQACESATALTPVYATLLALINSVFPSIGRLAIQRILIRVQKSLKSRRIRETSGLLTLLSHLIYFQVALPLLVFETSSLLIQPHLLSLLCPFLEICGGVAMDEYPRLYDDMYGKIRDLYSKHQLKGEDSSAVERLFDCHRKGYQSKIQSKLIDYVGLVDPKPHDVEIDENLVEEKELDKFQLLSAESFREQEDQYKRISGEVIQDFISKFSVEPENDPNSSPIHDEIFDEDENLAVFKRDVYITITSSISAEETCHKLLKLQFPKENLNPTFHLCKMILDTCQNFGIFNRVFSLIGRRLCYLPATRRQCQQSFAEILKDEYLSGRQIEINKVINIAKFFGNLLTPGEATFSMSFLNFIELNPRSTTAQQRIFLKYLFQELIDTWGRSEIVRVFESPTFQSECSGLFPDNLSDLKYCTVFWKNCQLEFLNNCYEKLIQKAQEQAEKEEPPSPPRRSSRDVPRHHTSSRQQSRDYARRDRGPPSPERFIHPSRRARHGSPRSKRVRNYD
ncbi:hypothetical protein P9112_010421 [Eukaryota sp. TZLM1-RC]